MPYQHEGPCPRHESVQKYIDHRSCVYCQLINSVRLEDDDYAYVAAQAEAEGRRRGWNEALEAARDAVVSYADETHRHVGINQCWPESGDRCDITAAIKGAVGRINLLENT